MKFRAMVADPKDGREFEMLIPANDAREAAREVKRKGLLLVSAEPASPIPAEPIEYETAKKTLPLKPGYEPKKIQHGPRFICPNPHCGFDGESIREPFRSNALGFLLLLLAIVPGILYLILCPEFRYRCPKCGVMVKL